MIINNKNHNNNNNKNNMQNNHACNHDQWRCHFKPTIYFAAMCDSRTPCHQDAHSLTQLSSRLGRSLQDTLTEHLEPESLTGVQTTAVEDFPFPTSWLTKFLFVHHWLWILHSHLFQTVLARLQMHTVHLQVCQTAILGFQLISG